MTDTELLTRIKRGLQITSNYQDDTIKFFIDETKAFMKSAGVPESVISDNVSVGCIMRGVADLWNHGTGDTELSPYFKQRVLQLKATTVEEEGV